MEATYTNMSKDELIAQIIKLNIDLETERAQVDELITDIEPIINDIQNSNKFLRFVKIVKLAFVLVERIVKYIKSKKD